MKFAVALLSVANLGGAAQAAITIYTTEASFASATTGAGVDTFNDLAASGELPPALDRTAGAYGYTVTGDSVKLWGVGSAADAWLSRSSSAGLIVFSGFTSGVSAAGANFFGSGIDGGFSDTPLGITVTATDASGTVSQILLGPPTSSFLGFVSTDALIEITVKATAPGNSYWPTVNNFTLAQAATSAVPEPASWAMMIGGLGLVGAAMRRRSTRTAVAFA